MLPGTERRQRTLHQVEAKNAEWLKSCLDDPYLLQLHILNADVTVQTNQPMYAMPDRDEDCDYVISPVSGKRRIDYCLYRDGDGLVSDCTLERCIYLKIFL